MQTLARDFDARSAGFGGAPKFPPSMVLEFLLRHAARLGASAQPGAPGVPGAQAGPPATEPDSSGRLAATMARDTLHAMARGGIYDQLGGGFARYSVDAGWVVPHFEKMLYDNALLLGVYLRWWRLTGDPLGERVARETADFLLRELRTTEGGFASALDADTEGEEGRFYVWTPEQLVDALGPSDGAWAARLLSVTGAGTFESGASTLQLHGDPDDPVRWAAVRRRLLAARETRVRPARDDKVVAAWNGLAVASLAEAAVLLDEPRYLDAALDAGRLLGELHLAGRELRRVSRDGAVARHAGVLEDYACVAQGFLALLQATGDLVWAHRARTLLNVAMSAFAAPDGGFHDTAENAERLVARPRDPSDNASPSGQSALVHALLTFAALTGSGRHRDAAERALRQVRVLAERAPRFAGWSLAAAEAAVAGPLEVAVVGERGDPAHEALLRVARRTPCPGAVVVAGAPGDGTGPDHGEGDPGVLPLLVGRDLVAGHPAAYVCRGMVCDRPVTDPGELATVLRART